MFSEYFFFPKKQTLFGYSDLVKKMDETSNVLTGI